MEVDVLSDRRIRLAISAGRIKIVPFADGNLQPTSYDIHIGETAKSFRLDQRRRGPLDLQTERPAMNDIVVPRRQDADTLEISPLGFMLVSTEEHLELGNDVSSKVDGKSTIGRIGLFVHVTAGLIDPGWRGKITLELFNVSYRPIRLWRGMPIGQLEFYDLGQSVDRPYGSPELGSHYQDAQGVEGAQKLVVDRPTS